MQLCLLGALYCLNVSIANVNIQISLEYKEKLLFFYGQQEILEKGVYYRISLYFKL